MFSMKAILHAANPAWSAELRGKGMRFSRDMLAGNDQKKRNECIQWLKTCASRIGWVFMSAEEKGRLQAEGQAAYDAASFDFAFTAVSTSAVGGVCGAQWLSTSVTAGQDFFFEIKADSVADGGTAIGFAHGR